MKNNLLKKAEKGQAILFAVVGVTIALAVGVTAASRNLSSMSRVSRTDTSARAYAAADGGIERVLSLSDQTLNNLASANPNCKLIDTQATLGAENVCSLQYKPESEDAVTSVVEMKVEKFNYTDEAGSFFSTHINEGYTKEVALYSDGVQYPGPNITVCWKKPLETGNPILLYYSYNSLGNILRGGLIPAGYSSNTISSYGYQSGVPGKTADQQTFTNCAQISLVSQPYGLRIKALYSGTDIGIFPSTPLPVQGYKITAVGKVVQQGSVAETKKVKLYRSLPYMPSLFDFAIYSENGQIN